MKKLTHAEINSIRELATAHITTSSKLQDYANQCSDEQIAQMFTEAATNVKKTTKDLVSLL